MSLKKGRARKSQSKPDGAAEPEAAPKPDAARSEPLWALAWSEQGGVQKLTSYDEVFSACRMPATRIWIDLQNPDRELLQALSNELGLHPLVTEDILERNQRAKIEVTDDVIHLVMFYLRYEGEIVSEEIDIVLGKRFLLTSHGDGISLREASFLQRDPAGHLAQGVDYALWMIADWLVDSYFPVFDRLGDEIDQLEDDVMQRPSNWIVERLFTVRRDLLLIRHAVTPQREIFNQLTNRDLSLVQSERIVYFRDVYDHLIRLTDELDTYRELVSAALDIYLSQVNNNLSEIVRRLTAVTVVLAGAGALAGVFGMSEAGLAISFEDLRFWVVTVAIATVAVLGLLYFRRIGWI